MKFGSIVSYTFFTNIIFMGFWFLMAVSMKMTAFWVVALCSLVEVYWLFRVVACCLCHQDSDYLNAVRSYVGSQCKGLGSCSEEMSKDSLIIVHTYYVLCM
jgi:hypothetical protein